MKQTVLLSQGIPSIRGNGCWPETIVLSLCVKTIMVIMVVFQRSPVCDEV